MTDSSPRALAEKPLRAGTLRWLAGGFGLLLSGYAAVMLWLYQRQEALLFEPEPLPADFSFAGRYAPEQAFEELHIAVPGAELSGLLFRQPASRGLVFYLHGNSGNIATWTSNVDYYRRQGFDLFMFDYRGFGKSSGRIDSEAQLHADVRAAWTRVAPAYAGRPVVILGRSLGSGLAVRLARDVKPALLVLITPYASIRRLTRELYPLVPGALLKYPLRSDRLIGEVTCPVLLVHGDRDERIPLAHARELQARSGGRAELLVVEGAMHGDIQSFPAYLDALAARLALAAAPPSALSSPLSRSSTQ